MLAFVLAASVAVAPAPSPDRVPFSDPESIARLDRATAKIDFFYLAPQFEAQTNKAFCGPASATIVLNALRVHDATEQKPEDPMLLPPEAKGLPLPPGFDPLFHRYTQNDLFDAKTDAVKTKSEIFGKPKSLTSRPNGGLQLRELAGILAAKDLDVTVRVADGSLSDEAIRKEIVMNLAHAGDYVLVNFLRSAAGQQGGGHISPLGAYDETSDSFLVMDVNTTDHDWEWIRAPVLLTAMRTKDTAENRGYLLVREKPSR